MIAVLRLGHRISRDKRITTHVCLVARAFGADHIYITTKDEHIEQNIQSVCTRFGGPFTISTGVKPTKILNNWKGQIIHLSMYGEQLDIALPQLDISKDMLIVVGAEKVPGYIYEKADFNIAIGNQPHSEVAALAVFLDKITKGSWKDKQFVDAKLEIIPSNTYKKVREI